MLQMIIVSIRFSSGFLVLWHVWINEFFIYFSLPHKYIFYNHTNAAVREKLERENVSIRNMKGCSVEFSLRLLNFTD